MPSSTPPAPHRTPLSPELEFLRLLWAVEHGLQTTSKRMARHLGLTGPQRLALRLVATFPGIGPSQLAHVMQLHPSTITGVLMRLERRALLERGAHAHDRRRSHLFVTTAGQRLNRRSKGTVEDAVRRLLGRVGKRRLVVAKTVLTQLAEALLAGPNGLPG